MTSAKRAFLLKTLMTTTALGGALAVSTPALAADECGAPAGGVVTCASGPTYTDISYAGVTSSTTINVATGVEANSLTLTGTGDLTVNAVGARFDSTGDDARAINVEGQGGVVRINAGGVTANGARSRGVSASNDGDLVVNAGEVRVENGSNSVGIYAIAPSDAAKVQISADSVVVSGSGLSNYGVVVDDLLGGPFGADVSIDVGSIEISNGVGLSIDKAGDVEIDVGRVKVTDGIGVSFGFGYGWKPVAFVDTVRARVGEIELNGGIGLIVTGGAHDPDAQWGFDFDIGSIRGEGNGVDLYIDHGDARVVVDEIATTKSGVIVEQAGGTVAIVVGSTTTTGDEAAGIDVGTNSEVAAVTMDLGSVVTEGDDSPAIRVEDTLHVEILNDSVTTKGQRSAGIMVNGADTLTLDSGSITTSGADSYGLIVDTVGTASVTIDAVSTSGVGSVGVHVADADDLGVDLGRITTTGGEAHGAILRGGAVTGSIDSIRTEGAEARGLWVDATNIDLEFGAVETFGEYATGVEVESEDGLIDLKGGSVVTHGENANGVVLGSLLGATLELGSVHTYGAYSNGVTASIGELIGSLAPSALPLLTLNIGTVRTEGEHSWGVELINEGGEIAGHINSIETVGDWAYALVFNQAQGSVTDLTVGSVTTQGEGSHGLSGTLDGGELTITAGEVTTSGKFAAGALLRTFGGSGEIAVGAVTTTGDNAFGMTVRGDAGDALLRANAVTTAGEAAHGVALLGAGALRVTAEMGTVTTSGDGAYAITTSAGGLVGDSEAVTVKAGTLTTSGFGSTGAYLSARDITVDIGQITTMGEGSVGAFLANVGGDEETTTLRGRIGAIDTSGAEARGLVVEHTGRFEFEVGSVHTRGGEATGIDIDAIGESEAGGKLVAGAVLTEGEDATGVAVYSEYGGYDVAVQSIETRGLYSTGLDLRGSESSTIQLGSVRTSGDQADGVTARLYGLDAELTLTADDVRTTGVFARGVRARAEADVTLTLGYVDATGSESDAVVAESGGVLTLAASRRLGSASGLAADLTGDSIDVTLASTAVVEGGAGGLLLTSESGSIVRNAGAISSANGFAIEAEAGAVTLDNSGLVTGRIAFADADDVVNNSGRFAAALTSNFGDGDDVFNNTGVLSLAEPTATGPREAAFVNLERLNNAGVIDLANGVAGDVFEVSGLVNGQAGGRIALDLDMRGATPTADRIVAGGFEGLNEIVLSLQGRAALGDTGVVIAESGMAQAGQEMTVRVAGGGFVGFDVAFANGEYRISGELVPPAFEPTKVATGAQHQWTSGADVVSARFEQMRDEGGRAEGRGDQVWAQVYGGSNDIEARRSFDLMGESIAADLSHEVKSQGVQAGVDRAVPVDNGALVFGMLAGAGKTELRFQNGDVTEYDGVGVGAYGHWFSGPLSVGVLAKLDTFKLDYDWAEANLKTRSDGFTVGARVDAAWRIAMGPTWYVEPQASLSWSDTALGRMKARDGAEVVFGDTRSMVGRIGVRAGGEMAVGDGLSFKPFAAVHALNEFEGDNASTLLLGDEAVGVADRAHGAWGRAVLGASLDAPSGLGGFIQAEADFGQVEGFTARAGVKFSW